MEKGVRTSRSATSPNVGVSRRSFSTVLQGAGADERRMEAREAAEARSTNKPDRGAKSRETKDRGPSATQTERAEVRSTSRPNRGLRPTETREQNSSTTQAERAHTSLSEAQVQDQVGSKSSDDVKRTAEDQKSVAETMAQPSQPGFDPQGQTMIPLISLVSPQVPAHENDQTTVYVEGEDDSSEGDHIVEQETESAEDPSKSFPNSSRAANGAVTVSDLPESYAHSDDEQHVPLDRVIPKPEVPVSHPGDGSRGAQVVKPGSHVAVDEGSFEIANRVEIRSVPLTAQSDSTLPQPEAVVRRISPASLGVELQSGKPDAPKTDIVLRDGVLADRSAPVQINSYAQSFRDAQDNGARTPWGFQPGPLSNLNGVERFSGLWGEQESPPHDQSEVKLPQVMMNERQASSGPATESMMAGAHGRVVSSPPSPSLASPVVSPVHPSMPTHEATESPMRFMTRSVVLDVTQPDLGHVNIRVALTNDMVHTHLSADRFEVGQFLLNGQDRLQAAFQANGLDMGQFRVDIDRQSAGRSFQQDSSPEQGQTRNQGSEAGQWEQRSHRQDTPRPSLHGLLNVVA